MQTRASTAIDNLGPLSATVEADLEQPDKLMRFQQLAR
jgi:hypothetical protein